MSTRRRLAYMWLVAVALGLFFLASCERETNDADRRQAVQTQESLAEAQRQVGMPGITNFTQRKQMKMIYELTDKADLITYSYLYVEMTGKFVFLGRSVGFGVPFSAQFTNPERVTEGDKLVGRDEPGMGPLVTIPQADPNGLFMPTSSSATWVMLINPETNEPTPTYVEPMVTVTTFPLSLTLGSEMVIGKDR